MLAVKVCKSCMNSIMLPTVTMMNSEHVKKFFFFKTPKKLDPEHQPNIFRNDLDPEHQPNSFKRK